MSPDAWSDPQRQVLRLLKTALREPREVPRLPVVEIDLLIRLARGVQLHARLSIDLKSAGIFDELPRVARDQLVSAEVLANSRQRVALWELDRIAWALKDEQNVPILCVKGCAYLLLALPNRRGRIFADVDLLMPEDRLEYVEKRLNARGWKTRPVTPYDDHYYRKWTHELPPLVHIERDVEIDMHHNILPRTARLEPDAAALVDAAVSVPNSRFLVPSHEDLVLHAATHLMFDNDLDDKLRDLVDIDDMLREFGSHDPAFWNRLADRAEFMDLRRPLFYSLRYARELLDCPVPGPILERISSWSPPGPILKLMDRLVTAAILPPHPDFPRRLDGVSRFLLYLRSHWIRMPPWLLAYHLTYKFFARRFFRRRESKPG